MVLKFRFTLTSFLLLLCWHSNAQQLPTFASKTIFETQYFIENHGQYNAYADGENKVQYAVQNAGDLIYFNNNGFVYHLIKVSTKEDPEITEPEEKYNIAEGNVYLRWLNANHQATIEPESKSDHYFSYGNAAFKSYGYKKITYRNLYPGIDVEYIIPKKGGIKYTLIVHPGADLNCVQLAYSGLKTKTELTENTLLIKNDIAHITEQGLTAHYTDGAPVACAFNLNKGVVSFKADYDTKRTLIIDPWVKNISTLNNGTNCAANIGFNVDFDYNGNLYVYGGDDGTLDPLVAKFSNTGTLRWVFMGYVYVSGTRGWYSRGDTTFNPGYVGNFIIDKSANTVYIGQGFGASYGTRIVRLDSSGIWDGFVTRARNNFNEIWDMNFDCQSGNVLGIGGGTSGNINMGAVDKVTDSFAPVNITGLPGGGQDILKSAFDPNGNLYVEFAGGGGGVLANHIFKINPTYTGYIWDTTTGYSTFSECFNKPFTCRTSCSNGYNALAANSHYLFYYDGFNIKAFSLLNGAPKGPPTTIPGYTLKMQGGIIADECGHVYVGGDSGNIKVFTFDTISGFVPKPDINIPGMRGRLIHDMRYSTGTNLIYVTGDSLAATVSPSFPCLDSTVKVLTLNRCSYYVAHIMNPDTASTYTFVWKDSTTNTTVRNISIHKHIVDTLKNTSGAVYYLTIIKNALCGGSSRHFRFQGGALGYDFTDTLCSGGIYSFNGQNITSAGTYTATMTSKSGCDSTVTLHLGIRPMPASITDTLIAVGDSLLFNKVQYHAQGTYIDTLLSTSNCDSLAILNLIVRGGDVLLPSAFVPGSHGYNSRLIPLPIRHAIVDLFCIFDRWGELIYSSRGDGNPGSTGGWDGKYKGQNMPVDTYVWYITFHGPNQGEKTVKGSVTLIR